MLVGVNLGVSVATPVGTGVDVGFIVGFGTAFFGVGVGVDVRNGVGVSFGGGEVKITRTVGSSGIGEIGAFRFCVIMTIPATKSTIPEAIIINRVDRKSVV